MHSKPTILILISALCCTALCAPLQADAQTDEKAPTLEELQKEFTALRFGMFIHFNMATYHGVEWVSGYPDPSTFDPGGTIDTDAWADAAKAAGMKYAVLTTKHVGGFCLWDSKYTTYDVMHPDCPYQQDLVGQFVKSFTSRGLKVGLYYCWRHPGFDEKYKVLPPECDPAKHSLEEQIEYQKKQVAELVEKYPEAFYIWNDSLDPDIMSADEAKAFIRSLGPGIIGCGNWWDWGKKGTPYLDIAISEKSHHRERQKTYKYVPAETCWTGGHKWFNSGVGNMSPRTTIEHIMTANARRANFLLNIGPDRKGEIPPDSVEALKKIGQAWIPINRILAESD